MSTQLHDAETWTRAVRQHIEAISTTLMFRERALDRRYRIKPKLFGGPLAAEIAQLVSD